MVSTHRIQPAQDRAIPQVSSATPRLVTETKLMQQYRIGAAVHGGGDLAAMENGAGGVEVFTVGTDTQVWDFFADSTSETGINAAPTKLYASAVAVGRDRRGRLVALAANQRSIDYVVENAAGSATRWGDVQTASLPLPPNAVTVSQIYTGEIGGALYVGALIELRSVSPSTTYAFVYSAWDSAPGVFQSTTMTLSSRHCVWSGTSAATAEFTCLDLVVLGYNVAQRQVVRYPVAATFTSSSVATTVDDAGNNRYFAVLNDGNLYQLVGGHGGAPYSWAQLTQQQRFQAVRAVATPGGVHLLALSSNTDLHHLGPSTTSPTGFDSGAVIQTGVALMTATALAQGDLQLFLIGTAHATMMQMIWQVEAGNWQTQRIEVPTSSEVDEYVAYSTDLQILDAAGAPVPRAVVQVRATSQTQIIVNGAFFTIDANTPATLAASAAGTLSITQQTNTLSIPSLSFDVTSVTTSPLVVQQFANVQERLGAVTGADLMNAKKDDGTYLLSDANRTPTTTASLAQACNQAMEITRTVAAALSPAPTSAHHRPGVGTLSRGALADLHRVAPRAGAAPRSWQLSASGGELHFRELTAGEAAALLFEKRARHQHLSAAGGFLDWVGSIGDFLAGVADGVISVVDTVINAVGDAIHAVITFVVNGVTYLFDTVVQYVEQAFDLVEVFFAQVAVFFTDLFEWLGFLFQWDDILRTHEALTYTASQFLTFLPLSIAGIQRIFDAGIANIQSQVTAAFDQLITLVGGGSLGGYVDSKTPSEPAFSSANANNPILNGTVSNAGSATYPSVSPGSMTPFDTVLTQLQQLATTVQNDPAFAQALTYMTNLGGSPDQIFTQLLSALLRVVEGLVHAMLAGVQAVVDAVLQLLQAFLSGLQQMLAADWNIPFVSDFYAWLTDGASLSLLDLFSLILAIPSTVLYKATYGAAPFPDAASITAFKAAFSAQTMLTNSGLGGSAPRREASEATALVAGSPPAWQLLLQIAGFLSFSVYGLLSAGMDIRPTTGGGVVDPFTKTLTKITLTAEILAQAIACPWIYGAAPIDCSSAAGVGSWFWIYESFGVMLDAGFTWYDSAFPENSDTILGIIVATLYGAGHTLLLAVTGSKLSGLTLASKIALVIPECGKLLKLPALETATEGISLIVVAALDALCIPASGLLSFADFVGVLSAANPELLPAAHAS
ncbi:MAG: hypothetical protein R3B48_16855 [Kofleriaceae bacterium]